MRHRSLWPAFTARRKELRLTCFAIAGYLTRLGMRTSRQAVQAWERKGGRPSESRIPFLACILRVSEPACYAMFALDFGGADRASERQAERRPAIEAH